MALLAFTAQDELQLFALVAALAVMLVAASLARVPASILLVLGGLALGFVPGLPHLTLPPDLVLVAILPPLLYSAAFFTGLRDLGRTSGRSRCSRSVSCRHHRRCRLIAHAAIPGLSWAWRSRSAQSSADRRLAATEIARRVGAPRRVVTVIEGEPVNDGLRQVAKTAVTAASRDFRSWMRPGASSST
jgi:CPA1 family monovalent cation:H+ antiporter